MSSILSQIAIDFPHLTFRESNEFRWSPETNTIFFDSSGSTALLLHEVGHALLKHTTYRRDIELLAFERDAWNVATRDLAHRYAIVIYDDVVQDALDTYRNWLHSRSICPSCQFSGIQSTKNSYKCLACYAVWRVNDARTCELRRYLLNKNTPL